MDKEGQPVTSGFARLEYFIFKMKGQHVLKLTTTKF